MTTTTFIDGTTLVQASWLNDVDGATYRSSGAYTNPSSGGAARTVAAKFAAEMVSVKDFGATGDGVTDDTTAITAAITAVSTTGGGVLFPPGTYCVSSTITLGNGDAATNSTVNGISLIGFGSGTGSNFASAGTNGATRIKWIGSAGGTVVKIAGPCRSMRIDDIHIDGNDLANVGLSVVHCAYGTFNRVNVMKWKTIAFELTTRSAVPAGVYHGNADLMFYNCGCSNPSVATASAVLFDSGYSTAGTPTYDTTRAAFDGGAFIWGGDTGSYGFKFHGADNNTVRGCCIIRSSLSTNSSDALTFEQWTGDTSFPKENFIHNPVISGGSITGTSGTTGNLIVGLPLDDMTGGAIPTLPSYISAIDVRGRLIGSDGTGSPWRVETADAGGVQFRLNRAAGTSRFIGWTSAASARWNIGVNNVAESGGNAGSSWIIARYSDAGSYLGTSLQIDRADGKVTLESDLYLTGGSTPGSLVMSERASAPSAPAANGATIYAIDNGSGKTQLMVRFASGASQQLAIQP